MADEVGDAERLVGLDEIEAEVRDARPVGGRGLGRPDVEAAEDLAGVGRDDRDRAAVALDRLGEPDGQLGLAGRGRPADHDQRRHLRLVRHAPTSAPRSAYGPACSIRTVTVCPISAGSPDRWTSLLVRVRPDRRRPAPPSLAGSA